jgi:hypothetical protein
MPAYQVGVTWFGREADHVRRPWTWVGTLPFGTSHEDHLSVVERWDPAETFCGAHTFGVVQSYADVPASRVRDKVAPYLTSPDAVAIAAGVQRS